MWAHQLLESDWVGLFQPQLVFHVAFVALCLQHDSLLYPAMHPRCQLRRLVLKSCPPGPPPRFCSFFGGLTIPMLCPS